ncbi:ligand-binding sensor domain-containing protein [Chondrinema litorale]|uniref:ligand-binding sensor domain-containing protein n=1 Tax=Chondrinema litorale TaxID=2994555 RepID=UPI002543CF19|nr:triple tyrosine motif-containing protein [Chondrinema litorale]UZR97986.1 triple tyrosine motif-containing protein [Chondrinema litorale]
MILRRACIYIVFGCLFSIVGMEQTVFGQLTSTPYNFYSFDLIKSEGLFKAITKDKYGYIWIASDEGLTKFNGKETVTYKNKFISEFAKAFITRKNGDFLVLHDHGLEQVFINEDTVTFAPYFNFELHYPKSVYETLSGSLFVGEFDGITEVTKGEKIKHELEGENAIPSLLRTFVFDEDTYGNLWAVSYNGRLYAYNRGTKSFLLKEINIDAANVNSLVCVGYNTILLGTTKGLYKVDITRQQEITSVQKISDSLRDISVMKEIEGKILIGTWNNGFLIMKENEGTYQIETVEDIPHPDVVDIFLDNAGVWIAGNENISFLENIPFSSTAINGHKNLIQSLDVSDNNQLVVAEEKNIYLLDQTKVGLQLNFTYRTNNFFIRKALKKDNIIWIGDFDGRVHKIDINTSRIELTEQVEKGGLGIESMLIDSKGNVWACGNPNVGVMRYTGDEKKYYSAQSALKQCVVIRENLQGDVFTAGKIPSTIFKYNAVTDSFDSLMLVDDSEKKIEELTINDIGFLGDKMYLATNKGLYFTKFNKDKKYSLGEHLTTQRVETDNFTDVEAKAIAISQEGIIWLANNYGLIRLEKDNTVTFYDRTQGLPSKIIKERSLVFDYTQKLWIGTEKGLSFIAKPDFLSRQTIKPLLQNAGINNIMQSISGFAENETAKFSLPYNGSLELNFFTPNYPTSQLVYQYSLVGNDTAITTQSNQNLYSIYNLEPGEYELSVKAKKEAGYYWSDALIITVIIESAWYTRWWVITLAILFLGVLAVWFNRWSNRQVINQKTRLESIVSERTEELNQQKNELIDKQQKIIDQKDELLAKNNSLYETQHALTHAELKFRESKEKQLEDELEYRNKQLTSHTLNILQKSELLEELAKKIEVLIDDAKGDPFEELKKIKKYIDNSLHLEKDWEDFKLYFEQVHTNFYSKLSISHPNLTSNELRHCALIRLNLSLTECASILGISTESVKISRFRLRKKLELQNNQSLTEFIMAI